MNKIWTLLFLLITHLIVHSQEQNGKPTKKKESLNPGTASSISFIIKNSAEEKKTFTLSVRTSDSHITPILQKNTVSLNAKDSTIFIIPLIVQAEASPGNKTIFLYTLDQSNEHQTKLSSTISISKIQNISLATLQAPEFAKAGELIKATILLKNKGNTREILFLKSRSNIHDQTPSMVLDPGEEKIIIIDHQTNPKTGKVQTHNLDLSVQTSDSTKLPYSLNHMVTIIPVEPLEEDIYQRFPISASIAFFRMNNNGVSKQGFQGELYGRGRLNNKRNDELEFRAVTKNPIEFNTFTQYEEYFINYKRNNFYAHLGDKVFSSSFLTEYARYGRGAEVRFDIGNMSIGSFYNQPRFFRDIKEEFNLYSAYNLNPNTKFTVGYLFKAPLENQNQANIQNQNLIYNAHLPYLIAQTKILDKIDLQGEFAFSKNGNNDGTAYRVQADGNFKKLNANIEYLNASPLFAGYYTNTSMLNSNLRYNLSKKVEIFANFTQDARNFQRDTLFYAAPFRNNMQYGLNYRYNKNGNIMLYNGYQKYDDRLTPKQFNYDELFFRFSVNHKISDFQLNVESQFGKTDNHITGFSGNSNYYTANLSFDKKKTSFSVFGSIAKTSRYMEKNQRQFYYGARIMSRLSEKSILNVFYQNNFMPEEYFRDRNQFEVLFHQKIHKSHSLDLSGRYMFHQGELGHKDFIISLRYTIQLGVPIRKTASYTTLSGNIQNLGVKNIEGIKLNLGHHVSISDKQGKFIFKNVVPGDYFLEMDRTSVSLNDISDVQLPIQLKIDEKDQNIFNFGMTRAAKIVGQINLLNPEKKQEQLFPYNSKVNQSTKSNYVIIEVSNGSQVFRKRCAMTANFDFTYLRPGEWTIKIYTNNLDKRFQVVTDTYHLILKAGEIKELNIDIRKKQLEIKHQKETIKIGYKETTK